MRVIHLCDGAVLGNRNGVVFTSRNAAAQPHTPRLARFVAACKYFRGHTVAVALVIVLVFAGVSAVAMHDGDGFFGLLESEIEYSGDVFLALFGSRVTLSQSGFALNKRFGKGVASGISAAAAVGARKVPLYVVDTRVALHRHFSAEVSEEKRKDTCDAGDDYCGKHEFHEDSRR